MSASSSGSLLMDFWLALIFKKNLSTNRFIHIQDGAKNESLLVSLGYSSDQLNNSIPWMYSTETPEWTQGQIELRSEMVEDKYVNWMITIMGVKPGNLEAFIAVDDFAFHSTDICETLPPGAGTGGDVTTTTVNPPCNSDQFTCDDGSCVPSYKVCDFIFDCNDSSDEQTCPTFYTFEDTTIDTPYIMGRHIFISI